MAYKIKGDVEIARGLGLGRMTTAERVAYAPASEGYTVWDSDLDAPFVWNGTDWENLKNTSDIFKMLDQADVSTGDQEPVREIEIGGQLVARIEGTSAADFAFYSFAGQAPTTANVYLRVKILRQTGTTNTLCIRHGDLVNGFADIIIDPVTGVTHVEAFNNVGTDYTAALLVESNFTDTTLEYVFDVPFAPLSAGWTLIADHSDHVADITAADVAVTGFIDLVDINFNEAWRPSALQQVRLDASVAAVALTLPAATGTNDPVFYVLDDKTNTASITVAAGESLNAVTDGTFLFSNHEPGTQFLATDQATGEWVISVIGAAQTEDRVFGRMELTSNTVSAALGVSVSSLTMISSAGDLSVMPFSKVTHAEGGLVADITGWVDNSAGGQAATGTRMGFTIPAGGAGEYRFSLVCANPLDGDIAAGDAPSYGVAVNGDLAAIFDIKSGDGDITTTTGYITVADGDVVQPVFGIEGGDTEGFDLNISFGAASLGSYPTTVDADVVYSYFEIERRASQVVLAGMVEAETLNHVRYTLSTDTSGFVCPFDEAQGDVAAFTNTGGTITVPPGSYRITAFATRQSQVLDYELFNVTTGTSLEKFVTRDTGFAGNGSTMPYYLTITVPTDIQMREGDNGTSVVWNGREAGVDAGFDDAQPNYGCYLDIQQLPSSTVVNPDALVPEVLSSAKLVRVNNAAVTAIDAVTNFDFDTVEYTVGTATADAATDTITVATAGRYKIEFYASIGSVLVDNAVALFVNGTKDGLSVGHDLTGGAGGETIAATFERDLNPGDEISIRFDDTEGGGYSFIGTAGSAVASLTVTQLPIYSIVAYNPGDIEATALTDGFVELGANIPYPSAGAFTSILTLNLPSEGRYRIHGKVASSYDVTSLPNRARLFNETTGLEILGSEITLGDTDVATGNWRGTHSTERVIEVGNATTVALQVIGTVGGANEIFASNDGNTSLGFERLPTTEVVTPGDVPVTDLARGMSTLGADYDITGAGGITSFEDVGLSVTLPNDGDYLIIADLVLQSNGDDYEMHAVVTDSSDTIVSTPAINQLSENGTVAITTSTGALSVTITGATAGDTYKIRASQSSDTPANFVLGESTLKYVQLSEKSVLTPDAVTVDDQAASGYYDIGTMRMAWGTTPGGSAIETVTFPAGGFAAAPVVTFAPVGTTVREIAINSVSATQTVIEAGGSQVKHWHAIGLKP